MLAVFALNDVLTQTIDGRKHRIVSNVREIDAFVKTRSVERHCWKTSVSLSHFHYAATQTRYLLDVFRDGDVGELR